MDDREVIVARPRASVARPSAGGRLLGAAVVLALVALAGCRGKQAPAPPDAAPAPPPPPAFQGRERLQRLPALPASPASGPCAAYLASAGSDLEALRAAAGGLTAATAPEAWAAFGAEIQARRAALRRVAQPQDALGAVHNAILSALDRVSAAFSRAADAVATKDEGATAEANATLEAGAADLRFALGKLAELCQGK